MTEIWKVFTFESAHRLPRVPAGHKCGRLHGHSYRCEIHITAPVDDGAGWVLDFSEVTRAMSPIIARLDHHYLNEIDGLDNPTSELLSQWIWTQAAPLLPGLSAVTISETCTSGCVYRGL